MNTIPVRHVEIMIAFGVGMLLLAMSTLLGAQLKVSAALSEVNTRIRAAQLDNVEHFALTGQWSPSGEAVSGPLLHGPDLDREGELVQLGKAFRSQVLRSGPEVPATGNGPLQGLGKLGNQHSKPTAVRSGVVDGAIVVLGRFGDRGSTFSWLARPAVQRNDAPMVVAWVCGKAAPGAAWVAPALPPGAEGWSDLRTDYWCPSGVLQ